MDVTKRKEKKLDGNYTRMLRAILNKSWRQHPTKPQLYGHLSPITKTIKVRWTRHAGYCWRSRDEFISDVLLWTPHIAKQKQDNQLKPTYSSYVRIRDVALRTCQKRWKIGRSGERGSGISVLVAWHDDGDDYAYCSSRVKFDFRFNFFNFSNIAYIHIATSFFKINVKKNLSKYSLLELKSIKKICWCKFFQLEKKLMVRFCFVCFFQVWVNKSMDEQKYRFYCKSLRLCWWTHKWHSFMDPNT